PVAPPPLPPLIPARQSVVDEPLPATPAPVPVAAAAPKSPIRPLSPIMPIAPPAPERGSFEMRLGTYWLVRIGIVMLLTGLVFLGTYTYKHYIGRLPAGGKLALLYTAGVALLGVGSWLQRRREKEAVRNYGQVLFAGGLATVYF